MWIYNSYERTASEQVSPRDHQKRKIVWRAKKMQNQTLSRNVK